MVLHCSGVASKYDDSTAVYPVAKQREAISQGVITSKSHLTRTEYSIIRAHRMPDKFKPDPERICIVFTISSIKKSCVAGHHNHSPVDS